jgi:hypothetical protein
MYWFTTFQLKLDSALKNRLELVKRIRAAAKAPAGLGCGVTQPTWPEDAPMQLSDFKGLRHGRSTQQ